MKFWGITFAALCCSIFGIEAWSSSKLEITNAFSRRTFLSTSIASAVIAGTTATYVPGEANAVAPSKPNGLALVPPNTLQDKVYVITGASTGIGLESAKALAKGGATVVLTARTAKKGSKAVETVQNYLKAEGVTNNKVYAVQLDLDDLDNVKTFTQRF